MASNIRPATSSIYNFQPILKFGSCLFVFKIYKIYACFFTELGQFGRYHVFTPAWHWIEKETNFISISFRVIVFIPCWNSSIERSHNSTTFFLFINQFIRYWNSFAMENCCLLKGSQAFLRTLSIAWCPYPGIQCIVHQNNFLLN